MKWKMTLAVALFGASLASARSYEIILDNPSMAGNVELKPGKYNLNLMSDGSQVRFTDMDSGKSFEATARIENADKKFGQTTMDTKQVNGQERIQEIDLGGTTTRVEFQ
jgi:hypothetical protein